MNIKKRKLKPFVLYAVTLFVIAILVFLIFVIKPWGLFGKKLPKELETTNSDAISEIELNDEYEIALYYPEYLPEEYLTSLRQEVADFKEKNTNGRLYIDYKETKNQDFATTTFSKGLDNTEIGDEIYTKIIHIPSKSEVTLDLLFDRNYLEALAQVKIVVFDKTGTMTKGVFEVSGIHHSDFNDEKLLEIAAHIEGHSSHPIAKSIITSYGKDIDDTRVTNIEEIGGKGICACLDGVR